MMKKRIMAKEERRKENGKSNLDSLPITTCVGNDMISRVIYWEKALSGSTAKWKEIYRRNRVSSWERRLQ